MSNNTSKIKNRFIEIFLSCCDQKLNQIKFKWSNKKSLCIVLCSNGYPDEYKKNIEIKNLDKIKLNKNDFIFHAGTVKKKIIKFLLMVEEFLISFLYQKNLLMLKKSN